MSEYVILRELGNLRLHFKARKEREAQYPSFIHGLSPVQLGIMKELFSAGGTLSATELVGRVYGLYAPQLKTDIIYNECLNLSREWVTRYPLLASEGCGSPFEQSAPPPWENRFTLTQIGELMRDVLSDAPPQFPHILVNGFYGAQAAIPPHCLVQVVSAIVAVIKNAAVGDTELQQLIGVPDFPSGCLIEESPGSIHHLLSPKKAMIRQQPEFSINETSSSKSMIVTRFPSGKTPQDLIAFILEAEKEIKGLRKIVNESLSSGCVRIELSPAGDIESLRRLILTGFKAEVKFKCKMVVSAEGGNNPPKSGIEILRSYVSQRIEFIAKRDLIGAGQAASKMESELMAIVKQYDQGRVGLVQPLIATDSLSSCDPMLIIITALGMIRRVSAGAWRPQDRGGRGIECIPESAGDKVKDSISRIVYGLSNDTLVMASTKGSVYFRQFAKIMEGTKDTIGEPISSLLAFENGEGISAVTSFGTLDATTNLVIVTAMGLIKAVSMGNYESAKNAGRAAIKLNDDDRVVALTVAQPDSDIILLTKLGNAVRLSGSMLKAGSPATKGTRSTVLDSGDQVVGISTIPSDEATWLCGNSNGNGKLTYFKEFKVQEMGSRGIQAIKAGDDSAISCEWIEQGDEVFAASEQGRVLRLSSSDIPVTGRGGIGVVMIKLLSSDDRMVSVSRVPSRAENLGTQKSTQEVSDE